MNPKRLFAVMAVLAALAVAMLVPSGATAAKGGRVSGLDEEWLTTSLQGDLFEVKGGALAMKNSTDSGVTQLGKMLKGDHAKSYGEGSKLAKQLGIEVPKSPTFPQKWELSQLGSMTGSEFDQGYTGLEELDHMQDIKDAKGEIEDGSNKLVIAAAKENLAMYKQHLALVRKTQQGL
jgi:predicted outer membrane protein